MTEKATDFLTEQPREILFKGKRKDNGQWIFGHYVEDVILDKNTNTKTKQIYIGLGGDVFNHILYEVFPESVGQFINSNDREHNKVFEGDILESPGKEKFVVKWYAEELRWAMLSKNTWYNLNMGLLKVIGNITDNPELI